ncbi:hypothetical protein B566_EDAN016100, partial [Ephemera danica]
MASAKIPAVFTPKEKQLSDKTVASVCCLCSSNSRTRRDLTFHGFPKKGTNIMVKDNVTGETVKKDRLALWLEFTKFPENRVATKRVCSLHFLLDDFFYAGAASWKARKALKRTAVPSILHPDECYSTSKKEEDDEMQTADDAIHPPDMVCAVYATPDANQQQGSSKKSRFKCWRRHEQFLLSMFAVGSDLPKRVCESCIEKLDVTHELVACSQRAKIMLQQMKKQIGNCSVEVQNPMSSQCAVEAFEHVDIQQTQHFQIKVEPENSDSNSSILSDDPDSSSSDEENAAHSNEKSTDKTVIYKGYLTFHVNLIHGELQPVARKVVDERSQQEIEEDRRRQLILEPRDCQFCKKQFYSQVLDVHVLLRHTEPSSTKIPDLPETDPSRLMQCPLCPGTFFPEFMQGHIAEEHPPAPNPNLKCGKRCAYCDLKISHYDMEEHLDSEHGPNAWRKCIHCRKKFRNTDTDMEVHLFQEHHGGKLLVCRICDERYAKTGKEQAHMQTFYSCKYKCPLKSCKKTFVTSSSYRDHVFFFHPKIEEDMKVEIERETEDIIEVNRPLSLDDLEDEVTVEEPDAKCQPPKYEPVFSQIRRPDYGGPVNCDICKGTVKHKWYLIQHKNEVHCKDIPFNCQECGKNYKHMQGLLDHLHRFHMPKEYTCETCGEAFTKRRYAMHLKWHERYPNGPPQRNLLDRPLDPVRCGMCNRPARNKYALLTHINSVHLDVVGKRLPFHCEPCKKKFVSYEYLMQHHYSVHLPKLVCTYCGKLVTQNRMSMHLKIHEPDRGSDYRGRKRGRKPAKS